MSSSLFIFTWRHHSHNYDTQSYQDTSRCGKSYKWPSRAGSGRETSDKTEGKVKEFWGGHTDFASTPARLFPPVDFTSETTKRHVGARCHCPESGILETTRRSHLHAIRVAIFISTLSSRVCCNKPYPRVQVQATRTHRCSVRRATGIKR